MAKVIGQMPDQVQWAAAGYGQITPAPTSPLASLTPTELTLFYILDTASMAASAYHGYKRNNSIGWALWWGFCGTIAPVITPVIAMAQGFAKPISARANRRRRHRRSRR